MLDVRRLRLLRELRERGTLAAVADELAYTPSAVSQQLAQLEREAGVPLLERVGRRVRLTDAGLMLADHTDAILARLEQAEAQLEEYAGGIRGIVRVAAFQTAARGLVGPVLDPLAERHPDLRMELLEMEAEEALVMLRTGDVDIVVAEEYREAPRPRDPALDRLKLATDRLLLALPADHPAAASGEPISLRTLAGEPWCSTRDGTLYAAVVLRVCRERGGFDPDIRHRANDVQLLIRMAATGHAISLVPALGEPQSDPGVAVRAVAGGRLERQIFAAVRRGSLARPSIASVLEALGERAVQLGLA